MATAVEVKKREGESVSALLYRFTTKVKRSGILIETRKRRFRGRAMNRTARRASALHRETKKKEMERARKLGITVKR